jgi:hypothetical protein
MVIEEKQETPAPLSTERVLAAAIELADQGASNR